MEINMESLQNNKIITSIYLLYNFQEYTEKYKNWLAKIRSKLSNSQLKDG